MTMDFHSSVDTSRPFSSVKEAVAIFGERFLAAGDKAPFPSPTPSKQHYLPTTTSPCKSFSPPIMTSPNKTNKSGHEIMTVRDTLKKLEAELEETKAELKVIKERESETEVALASLNAELHQSMSRMAQAEAQMAGKAAAAAWLGAGEREDVVVRVERSSPSLAQILSISENGMFGGSRKKKEKKKKKKKKKKVVMVKKEKPIIPLVGDLFSWKKTSSTTLHNPLYSIF